MPALPRLFRGLGLGSLAVIVALGLALPLTARASGTGKGEGSGASFAKAYGEGASALWAQDKALANKFERKQAGQKSAHDFDRPSNKRPKGR